MDETSSLSSMNKSIGTEDTFTLSYMNFNEELCDALLEDKIKNVAMELESHLFRMEQRDIHVIPSTSAHFRHRCKFTIIHSNELMPDIDVVSYAMWEGGAPTITVNKFPIASKPIFETMPVLLAFVQDQRVLKRGLRGLHFLSTTIGDVIATLIYDIPLDQAEWGLHGKMLQDHVANYGLLSLSRLTIMGRSRGIRIHCGTSCTVNATVSVFGDTVESDVGDRAGIVHEQFDLLDGRRVKYSQKEDGFSNPNAEVNRKALDWICGAIRYSAENLASQQRSAEGSEAMGSLCATGINILELYCGNGNHTVAIAEYCHRLVAVEINDSLCVAARNNLKLNSIENATVVAGDARYFSSRVLRNKCWVVKETGEKLPFSLVLLDPPRCGLDDVTCELVARYEYIVYISCNPLALKRDLDRLSGTHKIARFAVFDQFAYTPHLECGVLLTRLS